MAGIGLKYFAWAKMLTEPTASPPTYDTGFALTKLIRADLTITNAEGTLDADDTLAEEVSEFYSAELSLEGDHLTLDRQATIYGATYSDNELSFGSDDTAPYGGCGLVQPVMKNSVVKYRAFLFAKAHAKRTDMNLQTKSGGTVTFTPEKLQFTLMQPSYGKWERIKEFDTFAAAQAYIDTALGVATWHPINVIVSGGGETEYASPVGVKMVPDAGGFTLEITGIPDALYDNGVDVKTSISGGKYALTNVTAAHNIAVIFTEA